MLYWVLVFAERKIDTISNLTVQREHPPLFTDSPMWLHVPLEETVKSDSPNNMFKRGVAVWVIISLPQRRQANVEAVIGFFFLKGPLVAIYSTNIKVGPHLKPKLLEALFEHSPTLLGHVIHSTWMMFLICIINTVHKIVLMTLVIMSSI